MTDILPTFEQFKLSPLLQRAINDLGFSHATPIQAQVLHFTLAGHDAIGRAQTGTGKTAAFLITIINDLLNKSHQPKNVMWAKHAP
jgi:ATP-dependent RNA helicase RhlB